MKTICIAKRFRTAAKRQ